MKAPSTRTPLTKIISQICQDRHPDVFDLKQNNKLFLSASKSRPSFIIWCNFFQFFGLVDLDSIKTELDQLKQQLQVESFVVCLFSFCYRVFFRSSKFNNGWITSMRIDRWEKNSFSIVNKHSLYSFKSINKRSIDFIRQ